MKKEIICYYNQLKKINDHIIYDFSKNYFQKHIILINQLSAEKISDFSKGLKVLKEIKLDENIKEELGFKISFYNKKVRRNNLLKTDVIFIFDKRKFNYEKYKNILENKMKENENSNFNINIENNIGAENYQLFFGSEGEKYQNFLKILFFNTNFNNYYKSNIDGSFYIVVDKKEDEIITLEINVNLDSVISLNVVTFSLLTKSLFEKYKNKNVKYAQIKDRSLIEINKPSREEIEKNEKNKIIYIDRKSFKNSKKRNFIEFINFKNKESFQKTKCGFFSLIFSDVNDFLNSYLKEYKNHPSGKLELKKQKIYNIKTKNKKDELINPENLKKKYDFNNLKFIIFCDTKNENHLKESYKVQELFKKDFQIDVNILDLEELKNKKYNEYIPLVIEYDKNYYKNTKKEDPYLKLHNINENLSFITREVVFEKNEKNKIKKEEENTFIKNSCNVIQNAIIKFELSQNKILNNSLSEDENVYTYVTLERNKIKKDKINFVTYLKFKNNEIISKNFFHFLDSEKEEIDFKSKLSFENKMIYNKLNEIENKDRVENILIINDYKKNIEKTCYILKSNLFPLPDVEKITETFNLPEANLSKNELETIFAELKIELDKENKEKFESFFEEEDKCLVKKIIEELKIPDKKKEDKEIEDKEKENKEKKGKDKLIITGKKKGDMNELIIDKYKQKFMFSRNENSRKRLSLEFFENINYFLNDASEELSYFVAKKDALNEIEARAFNIRNLKINMKSDLIEEHQLIDEDLKKEFEDTYLKLIEVFFVRNNQYTVLPYFAKYCREYSKIQINKLKYKNQNKFNLIAAIGKNNEIGINDENNEKGKLLWNIPEELEHFKKITKNKIVVMGHKTYNSIGKLLENRTNVILGNSIGIEEKNEIEDKVIVIENTKVLFYEDIDDFVSEYYQKANEVFIIGGGKIFEVALQKNLINKMYLSKIDYEFEKKDNKNIIYFPKYNENEWNKKETKEYKNWKFEILEKKNL